MCIFEVLPDYNRRYDTSFRVDMHFLVVQVLALQAVLADKLHVLRCELRNHMHKFILPTLVLGAKFVIKHLLPFYEATFVSEGDKKKQARLWFC